MSQSYAYTSGKITLVAVWKVPIGGATMGVPWRADSEYKDLWAQGYLVSKSVQEEQALELLSQWGWARREEGPCTVAFWGETYWSKKQPCKLDKMFRSSLATEVVHQPAWLQETLSLRVKYGPNWRCWNPYKRRDIYLHQWKNTALTSKMTEIYSGA